jgi:hypothetical protein
MKTLRSLASLLLLAVALLPLTAHAADRTSVQAILVLASSAKGPADARLAPYEGELQRNLPESSFRWAGEGSAAVSPGAKATLSLGNGHRLELEGAKGGAVSVSWFHGNTKMIGTTLSLQPGVPAVLLRRPGGHADVPLVILVAR